MSAEINRKRGRESETYLVEGVLKREEKKARDKSTDVKVQELNIFLRENLPPIAVKRTAETRLKELIRLCTVFQRTGNAYLWLTHKVLNAAKVAEEHWLDLRVESRTYDSSFAFEAVVSKVTTPPQIYHMITLYEHANLTLPLIKIRVDKKNQLAELCHINSGRNVRGGDVKKIAMRILDTLRPRAVHLLDDAKRPVTKYTKTTTGAVRLQMYKYMPIVTADGETWYGQNGFYPMSCENLVFIQAPFGISQDRRTYYSAVKYLRQRSLTDLSRQCSGAWKRKLAGLQRITLLCFGAEKESPKSKEKWNVLYEGKSLHQLGKTIFLILTGKTAGDKKQASNALITLHDEFLTCTSSISKLTPEQKIYNKALDVLCCHSVCIKTYDVPNENGLCYLTSQKLKPFSEIASGLEWQSF